MDVVEKAKAWVVEMPKYAAEVGPFAREHFREGASHVDELVAEVIRLREELEVWRANCTLPH